MPIIRMILISILLVSPACTLAKPAFGQTPEAVETIVAGTHRWPEQIPTIATVNATDGITVCAESEGRITSIAAKSGTLLKKGDLICRINPAVLQSQLSQALAQQESDRKDYERAKLLIKKNDISRQNYDHARYAYDQSRALVTRINARLDLTRVRAPFDGKLGLLAIRLGDYVTAGHAIADFQSLNTLRVDFNLPQQHLARLALGQRVVLHVDWLPDQQIEATVYAIDAAIDPVTRAIGMRALIAHPPKSLLPGAFAKARLITDHHRRVLAVPRTAVGYSPEGAYVYTVVKGRAVKTEVTTGERRENMIALLSGVSAGDRLIGAGIHRIRNGSAVAVAE